MFERYTESARRVLFFARYEANELGGTAIETEHLLLGLARVRGLVSHIFAEARITEEELRREIEGRAARRPKLSTSVEIPFSRETRRVLQFAAEEADRLKQGYIGPEHLLLGLLLEETVAASILNTRGLRSDDVRNGVVRLLAEPHPPLAPGASPSQQIEQIKQMVDQLAAMAPPSDDADALARRIRGRLDRLRGELGETAG
jgi:ATP-dependent Clp protease ATP-binding subunit ClpC